AGVLRVQVGPGAAALPQARKRQRREGKRRGVECGGFTHSAAKIKLLGKILFNGQRRGTSAAQSNLKRSEPRGGVNSERTSRPELKRG
ncbi:hypothetical protein AMECASPLE_011275, partial [Ameca splendens]